MTMDDQQRRTPGGVFFRLVKEYVFATDKTLYGRIFWAPKRKPKPKKKPTAQGQKSAKQPVPATGGAANLGAGAEIR